MGGPSIGDHALLGDGHSAALVSREGSVDWACFPRFDSPSVFAAILDEQRGGSFDISAEDVRNVTRAYVEDTNVLRTVFTTGTGVVEVTDCMPTDGARAHHAILRRLRCLDGEVDVRVSVSPRYEYGRFVPHFVLTSEETAEAIGGADAMTIVATRLLEEEAGRIKARWHLRRGESAFVQVAWRPSYERRGEPPEREDLERRLDGTIDFWRRWISRCAYDGPDAAAVRRSALVLKALIYGPSGAVVAAPTTSLPEAIGGVRNWDYRYTWIRDATLTLISLSALGFREEADAFRAWLERTSAGRPEDLQIMYGIGGERSLPELEIEHLSGHRGSRPVRTGNGAAKQRQLDAYGQLLQAAHLYSRAGGTVTPANWNFLAGLADIVSDAWREPDQGIWEIRDEPRHFVHSKLNCWVALDRAVRLAEQRRLPAPGRWRSERDAIRAYLLDDAQTHGFFPQAVGSPAPDASALLVPAMGFVPSGHPLVRGTVEVVRRELDQDGFVHRYRHADGLAGGEGAFLLCSFWLLDVLAHQGEVDGAESVLERMTGCANDLGLWAEEWDPDAGQALGNFPQAFTHMAHVTSCLHLDAARRGETAADQPVDYAEHALDRLLARGRALA